MQQILPLAVNAITDIIFEQPLNLTEISGYATQALSMTSTYTTGLVIAGVGIALAAKYAVSRYRLSSKEGGGSSSKNQGEQEELDRSGKEEELQPPAPSKIETSSLPSLPLSLDRRDPFAKIVSKTNQTGSDVLSRTSESAKSSSSQNSGREIDEKEEGNSSINNQGEQEELFATKPKKLSKIDKAFVKTRIHAIVSLISLEDWDNVDLYPIRQIGELVSMLSEEIIDEVLLLAEQVSPKNKELRSALKICASLPSSCKKNLSLYILEHKSWREKISNIDKNQRKEIFLRFHKLRSNPKAAPDHYHEPLSDRKVLDTLITIFTRSPSENFCKMVDSIIEAPILNADRLIHKVVKNLSFEEWDQVAALFLSLNPKNSKDISTTIETLLFLSRSERDKAVNLALSAEESPSDTIKLLKAISDCQEQDREEIVAKAKLLAPKGSNILLIVKTMNILPQGHWDLIPSLFQDPEVLKFLIRIRDRKTKEAMGKNLEVSKKLAEQLNLPLSKVAFLVITLYCGLGIDRDRTLQEVIPFDMLNEILPILIKSSHSELYNFIKIITQSLNHKSINPSNIGELSHLICVISNPDLYEVNTVKEILLKDPKRSILTLNIFLEDVHDPLAFLVRLMSRFPIEGNEGLLDIAKNLMTSHLLPRKMDSNQILFGYIEQINLHDSHKILYPKEEPFQSTFPSPRGHRIGEYFEQLEIHCSLYLKTLTTLKQQIPIKDIKWLEEQQLLRSLLRLEMNADAGNEILKDLMEVAKSPIAKGIYERMTKDPERVHSSLAVVDPTTLSEEILTTKLQELQAKQSAKFPSLLSPLRALQAFAALPYDEGEQQAKLLQEEIKAIGDEIKETRLALKRVKDAARKEKEPVPEPEKKSKILKASTGITNAQFALLQAEIQNDLISQKEHLEEKRKKLVDSKEYAERIPVVKECLQKWSQKLKQIREELQDIEQSIQSARIALQTAVSDPNATEVLLLVLRSLISSSDIDSRKKLAIIEELANTSIHTQENLKEYKTRIRQDKKNDILSDLYSLYFLFLLKEVGKLNQSGTTIRQLSKTVFQDQMHLPADISIEFLLKMFHTDLVPNALFTYATSFLNPQNDKVMKDFGRFFNAAAKGTFKEERYRTDNNLHLRTIQETNPIAFEQWENLSISYATVLYPQGTLFFKPIEWLEEKKQLGHMHIPVLSKSIDDLIQEGQDEKIHLLRDAIDSLQKAQEKQEQIECLTKLQAALSSIPDCEFKNDVRGKLSSLEQQSKKEGRKVIVDITDDPRAIFLCGTEVQGSCQRIDGSRDYKHCLLGYGLDGTHRLIRIREAPAENLETPGTPEQPLLARAILTLPKGEQSPLLLNPTYSGKTCPAELDQVCKEEIAKIAAMAADQLQGHLVGHETYQSSVPYPHTLEFLGCAVSATYSDITRGVQPNCAYEIPANNAFLLHGEMPPLAESEEELS